MKHIRSIQAGWMLLLVALLLGLIVTPAGAQGISSSKALHTTQRLASATSVNATIYITKGTLEPMFQGRIEQQVPVAFNNAIGNVLSQLPQQDRGWALQMANTLIQPSASLTSLTLQPGGLVTSLQITLYSGDPQPINASMLISMRVINSSTVQVSATPLNGSPALVSGPLTTFQIPIGQLSSINTTPACGDAALALKLLLPVSLGKGQSTAPQQTALNSFASGKSTRQLLNQKNSSTAPAINAANTNSYVELPASSLASMGSSVGALPIGNGLTAQNVQIGVQGSDLLISSDIYSSFLGQIGTAVTTVAPTASGGNLTVHVLSTNVTILGFITFPYDSYDQQIQQTLNSKLNGALAGKFSVSQAAIGPNAQLPCAASNSLVLTGTANLG